MGKWTLDINIVDTRDEDNYTVNNWIMLEGITLTQATNFMDDIQKYAKLEEHEELNFIIAKEEEKENKTVTYEEVDKELEMGNLIIRERVEKLEKGNKVLRKENEVLKNGWGQNNGS